MWVIYVTADARGEPPVLTPAQIRAIIETYAKSQVDNGSAIGVEVGVTIGSKPPLFFSYGLARYGAPPHAREKFTEDTLFQIDSVTKIFTTNLLGQLAVQQSSVLAKQLSQCCKGDAHCGGVLTEMPVVKSPSSSKLIAPTFIGSVPS